MSQSAAPQYKATPNPYIDLVDLAINAGEVPFLLGSPGIGKSSFIREVAKMNNLLFIDVRLAGMDQTDIVGIPNFVDVHDDSGNIVGKRTSYIPNDIFPLQGLGDEKRLVKHDKNGKVITDANGKPEMYDGFLICLDELTSADEAVQAAAYQLILDRQVGQYKLLDNVAMVACGNRATDGAIAGKLGTALKSRVLTVEVECHYKSWIDWATKEGFSPYILDYLSWRPEMLHSFDPKTAENAFPCPRTWEKLNNLIKAEGDYNESVHTLAKGTIGSVSTEFKNFISYYALLPKIQDIIKNPKSADMPTDAGQVYALTGVLQQAFIDNTKDTAKVAALTEYMERMEPELQVVTMIKTLRKDKSVAITPSIQKWMTTNASRIRAQM